ncbi:MAG: hypothetical protein L0154_06875 [Chloroflexi bacterium]|nr:hypothetical protein [Chloroflexota bacterium]
MRVLLVTICCIAAVVPVFSQSQPQTLTLIDPTGNRLAGVYLGAGYILTSDRAVTGERYINEPVRYGYQVWDYLDDGVTRVWEKPLDNFLCGDAYTVQHTDAGDCVPYNLADEMVVEAGEETIPVERLVFLSRTSGIALLYAPDLEQKSIKIDARHLSSAKMVNETMVVMSRPVGEHTRLIPVMPADSPAPFYFSERGLIGVDYSQPDAKLRLMSPAFLWAEELWAVGEQLNLPDLTALLEAAIWDEAIVGRPSLQDPVLPRIGNMGYDVQHYTLNLDVDSMTPTITGQAIITLKVTEHHLSRLSFDLVGMQVSQVMMGNQTLDFEQSDIKLFIDLPAPLEYGERVQLVIDYTGQPQPLDTSGSDIFTVGLEHRDNSLAFANQPDGARTWFPANDHPRDRATFTFRITTRQGLTAVANGVPTQSGDVFVWQMSYPMATYLATIAIGDYALLEDVSASGIPVRNYVYRDTVEEAAPLFSSVDLGFETLEALFGPYPFSSYGHVVTPLNDAAIETQTMTILPHEFVQASDEETVYSLIIHELAHQWYGNRVTLGSWEDIWLNEGTATLAEWLALEARYDDTTVYRNTDERLVTNSHRTTPLISPQGSELFGVDSYSKGAWVLYMLRNRMGDDVFFDIMRTWAEEYVERPVYTRDFFQLAEIISGQDLTQFRRQWLEVPGLPRHTLVWTRTADGIEIQACNPVKTEYILTVPVMVVDETGSQQITIDVALHDPEPQSFPIDFEPDSLIPDPNQRVLEALDVEFVEGEASCLLALSG